MKRLRRIAKPASSLLTAMLAVMFGAPASACCCVTTACCSGEAASCCEVGEEGSIGCATCERPASVADAPICHAGHARCCESEESFQRCGCPPPAIQANAAENKPRRDCLTGLAHHFAPPPDEWSPDGLRATPIDATRILPPGPNRSALLCRWLE